MAKGAGSKIIGRRPVPAVAKGKSKIPGNRSGRGGAYDGVRGTKTPMGNRPVPRVAKDTGRYSR